MYKIIKTNERFEISENIVKQVMKTVENLKSIKPHTNTNDAPWKV